MRTIKVRAWDKTEKKFIDLEDGNYLLVMRQPGLTAFRKNDPDLHRYELVEWTGLLDKNGKEIYEGDIMRHVPDGNAPHLPFVVSWSEILLAWSIHDEPRKWCEYLNERKFDYAVIGNIYSTPELLK